MLISLDLKSFKGLTLDSPFQFGRLSSLTGTFREVIPDALFFVQDFILHGMKYALEKHKVNSTFQLVLSNHGAEYSLFMEDGVWDESVYTGVTSAKKMKDRAAFSSENSSWKSELPMEEGDSILKYLPEDQIRLVKTLHLKQAILNIKKPSLEAVFRTALHHPRKFKVWGHSFPDIAIESSAVRIGDQTFPWATLPRWVEKLVSILAIPLMDGIYVVEEPDAGVSKKFLPEMWESLQSAYQAIVTTSSQDFITECWNTLKTADNDVSGPLWDISGDVSQLTHLDKIYGRASGIYGDSSKIWGDISYLRGDVSGLSGNVSYIRGEIRCKGRVSLIRGNITGVAGDVSKVKGHIVL